MALLDTILQSVILSIISNVLAQIIASYQANKDLLTTLDLKPIAQFLVYTVTNVPINVYWQNLLEGWFPSTKTTVITQPASVTSSQQSSEKTNASAVAKAPQQTKKSSLNVTNTLIKFVADQTLGAAVNIPLFLAVIGAVKGQSADQIVATIRSDALDIYSAGAKLWPAVSLLSFAVIPVQHRVIFGSIAGVAWNIYLSLRAGS